MSHPWIAAAVFGLTYLLLSFPALPGIFIRRPAAALLGAVVMVAGGVVSLDRAYRLVDFDTIVFILGMMIIIGYLEVSGFFERVEWIILRRARTARALLALVVISSGLLSALFMNDTICLMLTPVVVRLVRRCGLRAAPYLIALATSANIGSAFTPMGNPQNMIVAVHSGIAFADFVLKLAPVAALGLWLNYHVIRRAYREEFAPGRAVRPGEIRPPIGRGRLLYVCLGASAVLLILLAMNVPPPLAAIVVAAALILAGSTRPREAFARIDWELLLMFASLFVVMGGLRESGWLAQLTGRLAGAARAGLLARLGVLSLVSALLSNVVSNVPAVVFLTNILPVLGAPDSLWLALAASSTVAGNLTIIGSVANLIVFESARGEARVGFWEYFKVGAPLAALLIVLSTLWLYALSL
ncbi:MAG: SLC13 family permease [Elusimicrobia bacterium]|nr:SLC13 family permease [Elusimicrobiota bacterium]